MHGASMRQSLCGIYLMHERLAPSLAQNLSTTSPQLGAVHSWRILALSPVILKGSLTHATVAVVLVSFIHLSLNPFVHHSQSHGILV